MHRAMEACIVEGMQGLAQFEHDIVGDVDHGADGTDAAALEAALHPARRRHLRVDAGHHAPTVARTGSRGIQHHFATPFDGDRSFTPRRQRHGHARQGSHLAGDAFQAEAISPIWRQLQGEQLVVERKMDAYVLAHRRIVGQRQEAAVVFRQAEFAGRAKHAEGFDAAHPGRLDLDARQFRADQRARHLHSGGNVRRATDDLQRVALPGIDAAELQFVGIGVLFDRQHLRHDDAAEGRRDALKGLDLQSRHGEAVRQLGAGKRRIDKLSQPVFGKLHDYLNCERKRKSPSKNSRRSFTP